MESRRDYFSDRDNALASAFGEGENSQQFGGLSIDAEVIKGGRQSCSASLKNKLKTLNTGLICNKLALFSII